MKTILEHLTIIFGIVFLVFLVLDYYNEKMDFTGNSLSRKMLLVFCAVSVVNGIWQLVQNRKN